MKSFKLNRIMSVMLGASLVLIPFTSNAKGKDVGINTFKDDYMIVNIKKDNRFDNGNADVVLYRHNDKYLVEKSSLKFLPIYLDKLKATSTIECSDCVYTSQVGKLLVDPDTLTGYFDYKPSVVVPEVVSDSTTHRTKPYATHAAGWVNIFASTTGDKTQNNGSSFTLDGSQTVLGARGNIRFTGNYNSNQNSDEKDSGEITQLSYNQQLFDDKYTVKVGLLPNNDINQFSSFYGISYGTSDDGQNDVELYDSYNFDISIAQPATYKLFNGKELIKEGFINTNRFKLTNIRDDVENGLTLVVVDRNGKKHVFTKELNQVTSDLKPWKGFWNTSFGVNKKGDKGAGFSFEFGLPYHMKLKTSASATNESKQASTTLQYHSVFGTFTHNYSYLNTDSENNKHDITKSSSLGYSWSSNGYNFNAQYNLFNIDSGEDYSLSLGKTLNIKGTSVDISYSLSHDVDGDFNNRLNINGSKGNLTGSVSLSKNGSDDYSAYLNLVYSFGSNWNANAGISESSITSSINYNGDNFSANMNSSYTNSNNEINNSVSVKGKGRYGSLYGTISDSANTPYSLSYVGGAVWEDGYFGIVPFAKDSVGLVTTNYEHPENITFNYGGNEYNLRDGYSVFAVSGNYDTNIVFNNTESGISTFNQNQYDFNPLKYFGDKFEISVLSGGLFLYSDNDDEHGVLTVKSKDGKVSHSFVVYENAGGFIDGLKNGDYSAVYKSSLDHRTCEAAIHLTSEYQEKSISSVFKHCTGGISKTLMLSPYEFNKYKLSEPQKADVKKFLSNAQSNNTVLITGHAGNIGSERGNIKISKLRALETQKYVNSLNKGLKTDVKWDGSKKPVSKINAENRTTTVEIK